MALVDILVARGPMSGPELQTELGFSSATLSRQVAASAPRVTRIGGARSTRYLANREVPTVGRRLELFAVGDTGEVEAAGVLHFLHGQGALLERASRRVTLHRGAPWFLEDIRPQGYLGRNFMRANPQLALPALTQWSENDVYRALAHHGDDLPGQLLVGAQSVEKFMRHTPLSLTRDDYAALAEQAIQGEAPGSSAGGEKPKFTARVEGRDVIVKFSPLQTETGGERIADLLVCEHLALETLRGADLPAAVSQVVQDAGRTFLEVTRFDRVGARGRRAVVTMTYVDAEFGGSGQRWSELAWTLFQQAQLSEVDAGIIAKLDAYSRFLMNSDAHFGNMGLFWDFSTDRFAVAPAYDVSPMLFAPNTLGHRPSPSAPYRDARTLAVWNEMHALALLFWRRVLDDARITAAFKVACAQPVLALLTEQPQF